MLSRYNILREISRKISNMISIIIYKIVNLIEGVSSSLKTKDKKFDEIKHIDVIKVNCIITQYILF